MSKDRVMEWLKVTDDVRLIAGEKELGGKNRYAIDNVLNSTECDLLMQLAQVFISPERSLITIAKYFFSKLFFISIKSQRKTNLYKS